MVELLEKAAVEASEKKLCLSKAGTIGMRDGIEYLVSTNCQERTDSGIRIYSCDADCDNCHCATY